ncbi:DUF6119 family protein [Streptomyces platensis]|uniref:DUF6119 family protein n=1 Tax=Streptomyces platensis TaxID=58346 RepID=UPI00399D5A2A
MVHVKKAATSTAPLKHLFAQGVVAVETLRSDLEIRRKFLAQVASHTLSHRLLDDFGTVRVVFAILLKEGQDITVESLFAFAQVSLLQPVRCLRAINAEVEIVAIRRSWSEGAGPRCRRTLGTVPSWHWPGATWAAPTGGNDPRRRGEFCWSRCFGKGRGSERPVLVWTLIGVPRHVAVRVVYRPRPCECAGSASLVCQV